MANKRRMRKGQPRKLTTADIFDRPRNPQIRLQNLLYLIEKFKQIEGPDKNVKDFAKAAGVRANYCSQITTEFRKMGDDFAAKLEDNLGLGHGWMDVEHRPWTPETPEHRQRLGVIIKLLDSLSEAGQVELIKQFLREGRRMAKEERRLAASRKPRR